MTITFSTAPIVTKYLIYMTITPTRAPFVTDWGVIMTISLSTVKNVTALNKKKRITISDYPLKVGGYLLSHLV